jgi:hypothetical protein
MTNQPNFPNLNPDYLTLLALGYPVDKPTLTTVGGGTKHLFIISGGRVLVKSIVGEVTTAIQAQATTAKLTANPTTGNDVDLCATSDLTGKEVGSLLSINGLAATALIMALAGGVQAMASPVVLAIGYLDLILGADSTGSIKWQVRYMPIDPGAIMAAA